MKFIAETM